MPKANRFVLRAVDGMHGIWDKKRKTFVSKQSDKAAAAETRDRLNDPDDPTHADPEEDEGSVA